MCCAKPVGTVVTCVFLYQNPNFIKESQSSCRFGWLGLGFLRGGHEMRSLTKSAVGNRHVRADTVGYMNFVMYVLGRAGMTTNEQRFAFCLPGHVVLIPQAGFFYWCLGAQICVFRDFTLRALLKRWYCVSLMFWVKIDRKFSVSTKNAPISWKTERFFQQMCHEI